MPTLAWLTSLSTPKSDLPLLTLGSYFQCRSVVSQLSSPFNLLSAPLIRHRCDILHYDFARLCLSRSWLSAYNDARVLALLLHHLVRRISDGENVRRIFEQFSPLVLSHCFRSIDVFGAVRVHTDAYFSDVGVNAAVCESKIKGFLFFLLIKLVSFVYFF